MLLWRMGLANAYELTGTPHQPQRTNEQVYWIAIERRLIPFDCVPDKLQDPSDDKERLITDGLEVLQHGSVLFIGEGAASQPS